MERLTNVGNKGEIYITDNDETRNIGRKEAAYKKLKEYEDLEEQGLLLRLPCKVGDTVYMVSQVFNGVETIWEVSNRNIDKVGGKKLNPVYMISSEPYELRFCPSVFGKTVFLTREAAKEALEKMKEDNQ